MWADWVRAEVADCGRRRQQGCTGEKKTRPDGSGQGNDQPCRSGQVTGAELSDATNKFIVVELSLELTV